MAKAKVTFRPIRKSDDDWAIIADYPGAHPPGDCRLHEQTDIDEWMNGDGRIAWLRSQGYAK